MKCTVLHLLLLSVWATAQADWRDLAGFPQLQAELGAALPTGAGIPVMMSEASLTTVVLPDFPPTYLPQATAGTLPFSGTGSLAGKTISPKSGAGPVSGHAAGVADIFCGTGSVSPGVSDLHVWWADEYLGGIYFTTPIPNYAGSVQNHSWVGSNPDDAVNTELVRRFDFMVDRDGVVALTPLNNGSGMQKFMANAYHGITAGLKNGNHPHTHSNLDGLGRMKPDIVVEATYTSIASPSVGSVATLLLDAIRPSFPEADDPRVIKAILLSGASKQNMLGWRRQNSSRPYDETHGAGELNVLNAYHILAAGRQTYSDTAERSLRGWDRSTTSTSHPRRYFFRLLPGQWGATVSATITWHRSLAADFNSSTLADLNLHLRHASGFTPGTQVDASLSVVDNVEHLFLRNLLPGDYVLEVSSDAANTSYGIAWEVQTGTGPQLRVQRSGSQITLDLSQLDPLETYAVEKGTDLTSWQPLTSVRTADSTPATTATTQDTAGMTPTFYRLSGVP